MYDVIALGELLVDLAERAKDENGYPTLAANPGGAPGNFLAALSAYGKKTAFLAKVGDDTFGHLLTGTMHRAGIDTRGILISPDTFTTLAFVTFDAHGDRSFAFARKPGADTQLRWEEIDPAMLAESRASGCRRRRTRGVEYLLVQSGRGLPHGDRAHQKPERGSAGHASGPGFPDGRRNSLRSCPDAADLRNGPRLVPPAGKMALCQRGEHDRDL